MPAGQCRCRQTGRRQRSFGGRGPAAQAGSAKGAAHPQDVAVTVTRDYGETADEKANELLFHLALATISIEILIAFAIGWPEAAVTLIVIPTTIPLTCLPQT
jgi:multidrug efflux pump subunit AcrB